MSTKVAFIITGGPGSGKGVFISKLARRLAASASLSVVRHRFAQEFAMCLDEALPAANEAAVYDFGSGCACCSPRGDFERAIAGFDRESRYLVVETSGLVASPAMFQRASVAAFGAARVVTVAVLDRKGLASLRKGDDNSCGIVHATKEQLKSADVVLLTGCDDENVPIAGLAPGAMLITRDAGEAIDAALKAQGSSNLGNDDDFRMRVDRASALVSRHDARALCACVLIDDAVVPEKARRLVEKYAASPGVWRVKLAASTRDGGPPLFSEASRAFPTSFSSTPLRASTVFGDWSPDAVAARLFVLASLEFDHTSIREDLVACAVPDHYEYACDIELDFPRSQPVHATASALVLLTASADVLALRRFASCGCDLAFAVSRHAPSCETGENTTRWVYTCNCQITYNLGAPDLALRLDALKLSDGSIYIAGPTTPA